MLARTGVGLACAGMVLCLCSCSGDRNPGGLERVSTYPVKGQVYLNGKPAEGVRVLLHSKSRLGESQSGQPAKAIPSPSGLVDSQGNVTFTTYEPNDGAPADEYVATFELAPPMKYGGFGGGGGSRRKADRLGGKYSDPTTSQFNVTVSESGGDLGRIELEADVEAVEAQEAEKAESVKKALEQTQQGQQ